MAEKGRTASRLALLSFAVVGTFAVLWLDSQLPPLGASGPALAGAPNPAPLLAQTEPTPTPTPTPCPCVEVDLEPVTQRLDTIAGRIMPANTLYLEVDGQTYALPIQPGMSEGEQIMIGLLTLILIALIAMVITRRGM